MVAVAATIASHCPIADSALTENHSPQSRAADPAKDSAVPAEWVRLLLLLAVGFVQGPLGAVDQVTVELELRSDELVGQFDRGIDDLRA
jgi:hypothetical protein